MKNSKAKTIASNRTACRHGPLFWAVALAYLTVCAAGVVQFQIWSQVRMLIWTVPSEWALEAISDPHIALHPHFVRALCVLPSMLVAEALDLDDDLVFSVFAALCMVIVSVSVNQAHGFVSPPRRRMLDVAVLSGFIVVSLFMNGRMCIALCGSAIMLRTQIAWLMGRHGFFRTFLGCCVALLLMAVSSGAFFLALALTLIWGFYWVRGVRKQGRRMIRLAEIAAMIFLLGFGFFYARIYLTKNLEFYDVETFEDSWFLLEHGLGGHLTGILDPDAFGFAIYLFLVFATLGIQLWLATLHYKPLQTYLLAVVLAGLFCGLFGYSTLAASLPVAAMLLKWLVLRSRLRSTVTPYIAPVRLQSSTN